MTDRYSRIVSTLALVCVIGAGTPALADSLSEPDAYAVKNEVAELRDQVAALEASLAQTDEYTYAIAAHTITNDAILACTGYSDRHYYKERVDGGKKKYRLPVMVWLASKPECMPTAAPMKRRVQSVAPSTTPLTIPNR